MRISLIRPPSYSTGFMGVQLVPYLGIAYIAASARQSGHSVDIIDMCGEDIDHTERINDKYIAYGMPFHKLKNRIKNTDLIGFTCMFSQDWTFHRELIQYVRSLYKDSILIAGGEHITALPIFCLNDCKALDICVVGEADRVLVDLLYCIEQKKDLASVPSLFYDIDKTGIKHTIRANRTKDIDTLPHPAWDLIPIENYLSRNLNYHIKRGRTLPMLATRGCPFKCDFCSNLNMWSKPWIHRNPKLIVEEMRLYIDRYNVRNFVFSDLSVVVNKQDILAFCTEIINSEMNVTLQFPTLRTEVLDRNLLKLMYRAGCRELDFAIESASSVVLNNINKNNNPKKMASLIKQALNIGFNLSSNIIIGLPKENYFEFLKTYWLIMKLAISGMQEVNVFPFTPYPGSKLFNDYLEYRQIELNDKFFLNLFSYTDLSKSSSFSNNFGPKTLNFLRIFTMSSFYILMFLTHPYRLFKLIKNSIYGKTTTKLENVVNRVINNIKLSHGK